MTTERYLLDTSVMLLLIRGGEPGRAVDRRFGLSTAADRPFVSIVTHAELQVLARGNGWGRAKMEALATALANVVTIDVRSGALLEAYASIELASRQHRPSARTMSQNDVWIAATAKVTRATILASRRVVGQAQLRHGQVAREGRRRCGV